MHHSKLTKIVATIGPASESEATMEQLLKAGVDVFRFNTKHNTPEWHASHIATSQTVADRLGLSLGILLDLQGPELRLETRDQKEVAVRAGNELTIASSFVDSVDVIMPHARVYELIKAGQDLLIDDGFIETEVIKVAPTQIVVKVRNDAVIKHRKGVNIPGVDLDFPSLIDRDIAQLDGNSRSKVDFVGLSFVRSAHDIELLRAEMQKRGMQAKIVGKIESQPALDRLDEIIHSSDAIMIARGDLGVEVPFEQLAYWQRHIIDKCRAAHKPVITATQMLESMINNPRPTRAEVTDVAHAVFDGTDAVMLSGESAGGKYPVKTVETMVRIAKWNESRHITHHLEFDDSDATGAVARAVANIVHSSIEPPIGAVLVFTETGATARALSAYRLPLPIICLTESKGVAESLSLSSGVHSVVSEFPTGPFNSASTQIDNLVKSGLLHQGDTIIVVHGAHWQKAGTTNALAILTL